MYMRIAPTLLVCIALFVPDFACAAAPFELRLRYQEERSPQEGRFHQLEKAESWEPSETAIIVCDMWDSHHCYRAVQREKEFAPRLNDLLKDARARGATIIHAPSDCMKAYVDHPARKRATTEPAVDNYPRDIATWCYKIPAEEAADYPIDQSDGGEDDTPEEHARWESELKAAGRDPARPWLQQIDALEIDPDRDFITDQGKEVWNILQNHKLSKVVIAGVHTNMCVLGRPFGLRRLATAGVNVALLRDMTDTMYNPHAKPFVSHFSGTDLIVDHIERYVCPTVTSDQFIGGEPFRFSADKRPQVAILISEPEYQTEVTLPAFAEARLRKDHRLTMVFGSAEEPNALPGIEAIEKADALIISARRRTPPASQLATVRRFVAAGKPVIGIRTASHAFHQRSGEVPQGADAWPQFDAEVFGGSYSNHYGADLKPTIAINDAHRSHALLAGIKLKTFVAGGSLYMVSPVDERAAVLMSGTIPGHDSEPVAWTFTRRDGGRSFYTSLGAVDDFQNDNFTQLLVNAVHWATPAR
jgi:nicotinamidase-related amidase/type 1 glutamine amidotransferase